jgi:hypothetical protein
LNAICQAASVPVYYVQNYAQQGSEKSIAT